MARINFDRLGESDYTPPDFWTDEGAGGSVGNTDPQTPRETYQPTPTGSTGWLDTINPPKPQDPYYADWARLNPTNPAAQQPSMGPQLSGGSYGGSSSTSTSGAPNDLVAFMQYANQTAYGFDKHTDPTYWAPMWASDPEYTKKRLLGMGAGGADAARMGPYAGGDPNAEVFGGGGGQQNRPSVNAFGYDDPSSLLYLNQALARLRQLQQPQQNPYEDLAALSALTRAMGLSGEPYTAGDDAALVAKYRQPLTEARDAALRRNKEVIGAKGMLPSSGLLNVRNRQTEADYEKAIAGASNDLAVRAVDERQRRLDQQLAILNSLVGLSRSSVDRADARDREALDVAGLFPSFDERRLRMLSDVSGGTPTPSSVIGNLSQLANLNLNAQGLNDANSRASASAWGQILGFILGGLT